MASLIPGYEYDIFISYRQKDNKHDGWVNEFVDNLKGELESTFKEEISVYFDINPHDGLLETHDVGASLKEKLKCLIFIPIISQTYCDSKSFAWQNEFCAFNRLAKEDQFGRDIRLTGGNIASRILIRSFKKVQYINDNEKNLIGEHLSKVKEEKEMRPDKNESEKSTKKQNFPDAYSHAALANLVIRFFGYKRDNNTIESIKTNAKKALSVEADNEIALMSLEGYYLMKILSGKTLKIIEYRDVIVTLKSLISKNPSSPMGFFCLAEYYRLLKKDLMHASDYYRHALAQCERDLQSDTSNGITLGIAAQSTGMLGLLEYKVGHFKEAIKYTEQSIQFMPGIARTYNQLSNFYFETDQPQRARAILDQALSKVINHSDRGDIGLSQGRYSMIEGKFKEADQYWANAMNDFSDPSNVLYDYAFLYRYIILLRLGDSRTADSLLTIRLKIQESNSWPEPLIRFFAGTLQEEIILKQLDRQWKKCETFFFLGEKDMISGDLEGAKRHFEDCINTKVTNYYEYDMAQGELSRIMKGIKSP